MVIEEIEHYVIHLSESKRFMFKIIVYGDWENKDIIRIVVKKTIYLVYFDYVFLFVSLMRNRK